ncbi:MAG: 30S ribosomal protein S12 methylthiotransferase RimO, partial [Thiobacillus sp.]|nr:30S ribosomal protein S12 methylthiotransferase RimO [Thiobacillus sp.]
KVIVTGCLGARESVIMDAHPSVLAVTGPHATEEVMAAVHEHRAKPHDPYTDLIPPGGLKLTPRHYAWLKISEGCNHRCSFCIIPSLRGDLVSRPIGEVLSEAETLVKAGVKELLIISQDTSAYGVDLKYRMGFYNGRPVKTRMKELVEELAKLGVWVRLHYVYPYPSVDDVIPLMAEGKVLPYLDVPLQHASPRILKAMKRPGDIEHTLRRIERWREVCPEIVIRSTFIVGFPGETEDDFDDLLDFLEAAQLDRVGAFAYSPVDGAAANALPDQVDEDVKQDRLARFMDVAADISAAKLKKRIGSEMTVLVDEVGGGRAVARSYADAPEIDGVVHIAQGRGLKPGELVRVKITRSDDYDLWGKPWNL